MLKEKLICRGTRAGLCNRLIAYTQAKTIAEYLGKELHFLWEPSVRCRAWSELFRNNNVKVYDDAAKLPKGQEIHGSWKLRFPAKELNQTEEVTPEQYKNKVLENLRELEPVSRIREKIDEFANKHFSPNMVGIHIRRGDNLRRIKKGFQPLGNQELVDSVLQLNKETIGKIREIIEKDPSVKFFLAFGSWGKTWGTIYHLDGGDSYLNIGNKQWFTENIKKIGGEVVTNPESKDTNWDTVVMDLFLLSKCKYILGNLTSSFSWVAAWIGGIELLPESEVDEKWVAKGLKD